jgi:hypothetical protein
MFGATPSLQFPSTLHKLHFCRARSSPLVCNDLTVHILKSFPRDPPAMTSPARRRLMRDFKVCGKRSKLPLHDATPNSLLMSSFWLGVVAEKMLIKCNSACKQILPQASPHLQYPTMS